jgi:hypothetical protein
MQKIFLIGSILFNNTSIAQDLKFMTNEGHKSYVTFLHSTKNGSRLISGNEHELFIWDVRDARVISKIFPNGKFEAFTVSYEENYTITAERQIDKVLFLNFWKTTDGTLERRINIDSLCHKNYFDDVKGVLFSEKNNLLVWHTNKYIFRFNLLSKQVTIDSLLNNHVNFFQDLMLDGNTLFINDLDYINHKGYSTVYKCGLDESNKIKELCSTSQVIKMYKEPSSSFLYLFKYDSLQILNLTTFQSIAYKIPFESYFLTYRSSIQKDPTTGNIKIASTRMLLEFDPVKRVFKKITDFTSMLGESIMNYANPLQFFTAQSEKIYLVQPDKSGEPQILNSYSDVRTDGPSPLYLANANQLICGSRYTNTQYNLIDLKNLSSRRFETMEDNTGFGGAIFSKNKIIRILVDYADGKAVYYLASIDPKTDSVEKINLNKIIPSDSLYYPEVYISKNNEYYFIKNPQSNTIFFVSRKTNTLIEKQTIPIINSGMNSGFLRPFLFTKKDGEVVIADQSIIVYNYKQRKLINNIKNNEGCCFQYFNTVLNHDSSKVVYEEGDKLYQYDLLTSKTDTIGFFRWISIFKPIHLENKNYWAIGYSNGNIELRDEDFKNIVSRNKAHNENISDIIYDSIRNRIITTGYDEKICFLELPGLQIIANCWILREKKTFQNVVFVNSLNQYYLSSGLTKGIHLVLDSHTYDFNSLDPYLNRPDIIAEQLKTEKNFVSQMKMAYQLRKTRLGIDEIPNPNQLPSCNIINKLQIPYNTDTNLVQIEIAYKPFDCPVKKIHVHVNNVPLFTSDGISVNANNTLITIPIRLTKDDNSINVFVEDASKRFSLIESVNVNYEPKDYYKGKLWVIGLGISHYTDSSMNLKYAAKDVNDVVDSFKKYSRKKDVIIALIDSMVFNEKVKTISKILKLTDVDDEVIIYYAGHGIRIPEKGFMLCLSNTDFKRPAETALPFNELLHVFDSAKARKRLIFIDACQSGDYLQNGNFEKIISANKTIAINKRGVSENEGHENDANLLEFYNTYFSNFKTEMGVQVIAASSGNSYAMEEDSLQNGLFTYCLIKGLFKKEAFHTNVYAPEKKLFPTLSELESYLHETVKKFSKGKQVPSTVAIDMKFDWDFNKLLD